MCETVVVVFVVVVVFFTIIWYFFSPDNKQFKCQGLCRVSQPVELKCDKIPSNRRGLKYTVSVQFMLTRISPISKRKSKF